MDFPGSFLGFTILFAVIIIYMLYGASRLRALLFFERLVEYLLQWLLGGEQEVRIGSIAFALLSGKMFCNYVEYRTQNMCIRILQATVHFNWWVKHIRTSEMRVSPIGGSSTANPSTVNATVQLPCRLSIELMGVEFIIHHNSYRYDHIGQLLWGKDYLLNQHTKHKQNKPPHTQHSQPQKLSRKPSSQQQSSQPNNPGGSSGGGGGGGGGGRRLQFDEEEQAFDDERTRAELDEAEQQTAAAAAAAAAAANAKGPIDENALPGFYRYFPVTKLILHKSAVMVRVRCISRQHSNDV